MTRGPVTAVLRRPDGLVARQRPAAAVPITVGLVNNMPDSAFADTEAQFSAMLLGAPAATPVKLRRYVLNGVPRGADMAPLLDGYLDARSMYDSPPDALIITGTEPRCADLRDEPYWDELTELLMWSQQSVTSVLLSCLASHASLLAVDGVDRTPLPQKCCGVYPQRLARHDLLTGVKTLALPHSRLNEVPANRVREVGYEVLAESATGGWTVAARRIGRTTTVMFQGHPEYDPETLLREYRRDVRRFVNDERDDYPVIPSAYLTTEGEALLDNYRAEIEPLKAEGLEVFEFPFVRATDAIKADWRAPAQRLVSNWLASVDRERNATAH